MILRRFMLHVRSENWFAVFLDFVVVVVGLFIGLQIDTWWEANRESRLEVAYLSELREDFEHNKSRLQNAISRDEDIIHSIIVLHEQSALESPGLSVQQLNDAFRSVLSMPAFVAVSRAYANLVGSGDLRLIQSRSLKNALAEYYAADELTMLVQSTHEMELVQIYEPYIIENLDYAAVQMTRVDDLTLPPPIDESSILDALSTRTFRNILTQKWVITTDLLNQHRNMLERTNRILRLLDVPDAE